MGGHVYFTPHLPQGLLQWQTSDLRQGDPIPECAGTERKEKLSFHQD